MSYIHLRREGNIVGGKVNLPSSKSISNRMLLIRALSTQPFEIENLSEADDTLIMARALEQIQNGVREIYIRDAGIAARFLSAYLALIGNEVILRGSLRMQERPMQPLVEALRYLGARIEYLGKEGHLPLHFRGGYLTSKPIKLPAHFSSQFLSALLMIAPLIPGGLILETEGEMVSKPYVDMTLSLMAQAGIVVKKSGNKFLIPEGQYTPNQTFRVEADWSSAAPWFAFCMWSAPLELTLQNLKTHSLQGDSKAIDFFRIPGFQFHFTDEGLVLKSQKDYHFPPEIQFDFTPTPDLAPAFITLAAASGVKGLFTGLQTLPLKECDRFNTLISELLNLGCNIRGEGLKIIRTQGIHLNKQTPHLKTFNDHRMVMAFTPIVLLTGELILDNPESVSKSYPGFWNEIAARGISMKFID